MKTQEKKQLIAKVIEKLVLNGWDITEFIGKPLSYFDYEKVKKLLDEDKFYKEQNGKQYLFKALKSIINRTIVPPWKQTL